MRGVIEKELGKAHKAARLEVVSERSIGSRENNSNSGATTIGLVSPDSTDHQTCSSNHRPRQRSGRSTTSLKRPTKGVSVQIYVRAADANDQCADRLLLARCRHGFTAKARRRNFRSRRARDCIHVCKAAAASKLIETLFLISRRDRRKRCRSEFREASSLIVLNAPEFSSRSSFARERGRHAGGGHKAGRQQKGKRLGNIPLVMSTAAPVNRYISLAFPLPSGHYCAMCPAYRTGDKVE